MRKQLYALFLLAFSALATMAQDAPIKFEKFTHDFGVMDQNAKAEYVFKFTNTSKVPVTLANVKASCGCTTPTWTKEPVAPGKTGEIAVTYNTSRVGVFNKSITVNYDTMPTPIMLYIKGEVKSTEQPNPEGDGHDHGVEVQAPPVPMINYTIPRGALTFEKMIENLREVTSENSQTVDFKFRNTSNQVVKIQDKVETDAALTMTFSAKELKPGQEAVVTVKVDGKALKDAKQEDGYFSKQVAFFTDEPVDNRKQMTINGTYKRVFSAAELANAPKIEFETVDINGGKIIEGEDFVYDFKFKNSGKSNLEIYSAKASCGCTATAPSKENFVPGESGTITATFHSQGRVGVQSKTITVKSNDPTNATVILKFTVEVVKDPFHAGGMMGQ